QWPDPSSDIPP
uniref:Bradykinin-potentiating peptide 11 n=1 Tax=Bothrops alternatus TaxID=64174 RepID=BPP11_BOTAL|nr:RecName: Full=Bradykinin-potentiating peptide 11; Short=BPP-11 [Bothrops alternatus]